MQLIISADSDLIGSRFSEERSYPTQLDEIDRETESPTQPVSEIHDFKYDDEDSFRIHLRLPSVALRRIP